MVDRSSLLPRDWLLYLQPMSKQLTWAMGMVIILYEDTNTQMQIKYTNTRDWAPSLQPMIKNKFYANRRSSVSLYISRNIHFSTFGPKSECSEDMVGDILSCPEQLNR